MRRLRVAVVGVGYLGRYHAEKYAAMEGVELVGVADPAHGAAEEVARRFGTRAFAHHGALLGTVDAVSVVVPTAAHFDVAMDFLCSGSDVLIEKPMTATLEQADALIRCAEEKGRLIQVGHLERFNPVMAALEPIVAAPFLLEGQRLSPYGRRGTDVSVVLDLMIHDIDIVLSLVPCEVSDLRASGAAVVGGHADIALARIEFAGGCVANLTASRISGQGRRELRLFQEDGLVWVDFANRRVTRSRRDSGAPPGPLPGMRLEEIAVAEGDALKDEIAAFVAAAGERRPPEVTGRMGRDALQVALEIDRQIRLASRRTPG